MVEWGGALRENLLRSGPAKHARSRAHFVGTSVVAQGMALRVVPRAIMCCCRHAEIFVICEQGALHFHLGLASQIL